MAQSFYSYTKCVNSGVNSGGEQPWGLLISRLELDLPPNNGTVAPGSGPRFCLPRGRLPPAATSQTSLTPSLLQPGKNLEGQTEQSPLLMHAAEWQLQ